MKAATSKQAQSSRARKQPTGANLSTRAPAQLVKVVESGLKFDELEALRAELDLPLEKLGEKLGIARATLHRRKLSGRLAPDESDRVVRFARLLRQAEGVFGTVNRARQWLSFPQRGLGGVIPLDFARTEIGAREVENLLGAIEYGVYT
ncbi:DUF2384 domain-containing protein [soil metagenome]